jgi:hypothetical protein
MIKLKHLLTKVSSYPDKSEEEDAEEFMRWCGGSPSSKEKYFQIAIKEFNEGWE